MEEKSSGSSKAAGRRAKTAFQLDTPFTKIKWPETPEQHQDVILELLLSLLSPIGAHRTNHISASKGRRRTRQAFRKARANRKTESQATEPADDQPRTPDTAATKETVTISDQKKLDSKPAPVPAPELSKFVTVGLNSTTRHLEALAADNYQHLGLTGVDQTDQVRGCKLRDELEVQNQTDLLADAEIARWFQAANPVIKQLIDEVLSHEDPAEEQIVLRRAWRREGTKGAKSLREAIRIFVRMTGPTKALRRAINYRLHDPNGPYIGQLRAAMGEKAFLLPTSRRPKRSSQLEVTTGQVSASPLAAVFFTASNSVLSAHLPILCKAASLANPHLPPIRLVPLPGNRSTETRLCEALGNIRSANFIGVTEDAPGAGALLEYVREHVPVIEVPWLAEMADGAYRQVNIEAVETSEPVQRGKKTTPISVTPEKAGTKKRKQPG